MNHSFFVSERVNERFAQKNKQFAHALFYHERPEQIPHGYSFFSWATWGIRSRSLFCHEWFAHSRSFVLSNLSELLTKMRVFERMREWTMSEFPTLAFRSKLYFVKFSFLIVVTYHVSIAQEFQIPPPGPGWIHCEREREREREREASRDLISEWSRTVNTLGKTFRNIPLKNSKFLMKISFARNNKILIWS